MEISQELIKLQKNYHFYFAILSGILIIPMSSAASGPADLQKGKEELQGIRRDIREKKKGLARAGEKEKGLLAEIKRIAVRLRELEGEERKLDGEITLLERGLQEKTVAISALSLEMERKKGLLYKRLAFLYKLGEAGYLKVLLSSEGFTDSSRRYRYITRVAAHDRELIKSYGRDMSSLSIQREGIRADKENLQVVEKKLAMKRIEIGKKRDERSRLLSSVRKEKVVYKESLKELEANARELEHLLNRLEREAYLSSQRAGNLKGSDHPSSGFEMQKGLMDFPVKGKVVGFFGKEIDKTSQTPVYRKGIDILTETGAAIKSVYAGKVIFADSFKGYGLMIIIDHGGGYYTIYAHAARLLKKMNDEINKDDIIGETGEAGPTGRPVLYFEVRRGGKPENPLDWLKS